MPRVHETDCIDGHYVVVESMTDENSPERGEWVDCWVSSKGGGHSNSLNLLEAQGHFDDGPAILNSTLIKIRAFAERYGYE